MKNKNKLLVILSLIVLCLFVGLSYALWLVNKAQNNTNIVSSGCFEISTDLGTENELDPIMLENTFPMIDAKGMKLDPFTFTLTNTCTVYANYQINLETLNTTTLSKDYLKAVLNTRTPQVLSAYDSVEKTLTDATSSNKLLTGGLKPGKSKTFNLRLWMDENTTQEQGENKLYEGQIVVIETPSKDPTPVNTCTYEGTLIQGAEYTDGTYTYRYKQEGINSSSGWKNITEDGWGVKLTDPSTSGEVNTKLCTTINDKPIVSMSYMFNEARDLSRIDVSSFDTSSVVRMNGMFEYTGFNSSTFEIIGLNDFDTSNVTIMYHMFYMTAYNATTFDIGNLSNWDTSNVTDMSYMFYQAGRNTTTWNIGDLSRWDTSNVTNMSSMFDQAGRSATTFDIGNLSSWDTSNVTDMSDMFSQVGENATTWNIGDLSSWDTSKVTDMSQMFSSAGFNSTTWSIGDLSGWDVSNVTNMSLMFSGTGQKTVTWNVGNLSNWNTSKVTNMSYMFYSSGFRATTWSIGDLSSWDTSSVTNMQSMFSQSGYNATTWDIGNLSSWDTSKVTNMSSMFSKTGYKARIWNIGNLSSWDTSNVTNMAGIFSESGKTAASWSIGDLSRWDTSKVTNMREMFSSAGNSATTWNSIGTLKVYATNIYGMFGTCNNAKATLNIYSNPASGTSGYAKAFDRAATSPGSGITVNYSSATTNIDDIIATKSSNSNIVKGVQLD